jgi:hypothetical protein
MRSGRGESSSSSLSLKSGTADSISLKAFAHVKAPKADTTLRLGASSAIVAKGLGRTETEEKPETDKSILVSFRPSMIDKKDMIMGDLPRGCKASNIGSRLARVEVPAGTMPDAEDVLEFYGCQWQEE